MRMMWSVLWLAACAGSDPNPERQTQPEELGSDEVVAMSVQEVATGEQSGVQEARRLVVRNDVTWRALWQEHGAREVPPPTCPDVNFTEEMVLAVFLGMRPSGGHAVRIGDVVLDGEVLRVQVLEESPAPGAMTTMALTAPYCFVRVPQRPGEVVFQTPDRGEGTEADTRGRR